MALLYMSNYYDWPMGGMLTYIKNLVPYLTEHEELDIDVWGCSVDGNPPPPLIIDQKEIPIHVYTNVKTINKRIPNFIRSFADILQHKKDFEKYDIIYSHTSATTNAIRLLFQNKFLIHHQHGLSYKNARGNIKLLGIGYTIAQCFANVSLFVASPQETSLHQQSSKFFCKRNFYSIGSPIDYQYIRSAKSIPVKKQETITFIYTGRIDNWKNISLLVEAFDQFLKISEKKSHLILVGDGPELEKIKAQIHVLNLEDFVTLTGKRNHRELISLLKSSDIFLFPSKGEGVSLSILEAYSAGLPVVGFEVTGVKDLIIDQKTGILVSKMTAVDFANGMLRILPFYQEFRKYCMEIAESYDAPFIAEKILTIIQYEYEKNKT